MKLTMLLLIAGCLQVSAAGYGQTVNLSFKNAPLEKVLEAVEEQTGYGFVYKSGMMEKAKPVSVEVRHSPLEDVLILLFRDQPLSYAIADKVVTIKDKKPEALPAPIELRGRVTNENGDPVPGATVQVKGSQTATTTDASGEFVLSNVNADDILVISGAEIKPQEIRVAGRTYITARINAKVGELDQVVMMAYGQTTRRLNTGNISRVTAEEISNQPVSNPLAAMQGRVPGLVIQQSNGVPGSSFRIQLRGINSLTSGSDPLFIIDGVPFAPGNSFLGQITSAAGSPGIGNNIQSAGISPLNLINPLDIESIEVLKDADATSIYGSRGSNGVILITTKKGSKGKTKVEANLYNGFGRVTRTMKMLNTQQYIQMRREAFSNDAVTPTVVNAPDLMLWDTTKYTDFKKLFIGGTAKTMNAQVSVTGGNEYTQFLLGSGYHHETTVFPGNMAYNRASFHLNLNHSSANKKFKAMLSSYYASDRNNLNSGDLTRYIDLPPNYPDFYDSTGNLKWEEKGTAFTSNPFAYLLRKYSIKNNNLLTNLQVSYEIYKGLILRTSFGYNTVQSDELSIVPKSSFSPHTTTLASATFGNSFQKSWIVEPQAEYKRRIGTGSVNALVGGTIQRLNSQSQYIYASNYTNDQLLGSLSGAGTIDPSNTYALYKYSGLFGRLSFNWANKYLLNLSGRRDGSSRFGPGRQFSNFGAVGAGWIFADERKREIVPKWISYGKLRGSYGVTGNDQIGNYKYLDSWTAASNPYQGQVGIVPSRLFNPDYSWEVNRKIEGGIELGFIENRINLTVSYFRNRSSNQLINYSLPIQTGFTSIIQNFPAFVQNKGWEIQLTARIVKLNHFEWNTNVNLTIHRNKLLSFPEIESSSYAATYIVGQPLSVLRRFKFNGIDPDTGIYSFEDIDGNGTYNSLDYIVAGNRNPRYYGGFGNSFKLGNWKLEVFSEFRKQIGSNWIYDQTVPGMMSNQPVIVLDRWQKPGDNSMFQKFTTKTGTPIITAANRLSASTAAYTDASFIRLKNVSLSYSLPASIMHRFKLQETRLYIQAQNLFVITDYLGADPETQSLFTLPPLKTFAFGILLSI